MTKRHKQTCSMTTMKGQSRCPVIAALNAIKGEYRGIGQKCDTLCRSIVIMTGQLRDKDADIHNQVVEINALRNHLERCRTLVGVDRRPEISTYDAIAKALAARINEIDALTCENARLRGELRKACP